LFYVAGQNNNNGVNYVAYLFAHDAGGFGLTGTDNVISCGSFTTDGSGVATVNLGYEPQWVLFKFNSNDSWRVFDNMRGMSQTNWNELNPNTSGAEIARTNQSDLNIRPSATGFTITWSFQASMDCIYIAIRRGPMKTPTTGTSVYAPVYATNAASPYTATTNFPVDLVISSATSTSGKDANDRLRGGTTTSFAALFTYSADSESVSSGSNGLGFQSNTAIIDNGYWSGLALNVIYWNFRRAPGFFDIVCYSGTGSNTTQTHNLGVVPELMIVKRRSGNTAWGVYANNDNTDYLVFSSTAATVDDNTYWNDTTPTASVFSIGTNTAVNASGSTYVAYLFATVSGVSKVGSYTGSGTTKQIDCGFTGGARFVLIKRVDGTGGWHVWDSARGIVAGNDPYLRLDTTAAEVTNTDYIDTYSAGFEISSTAPAAINANGGTFLFLAVA
jgi:hypothetical protein